jgi:hypothetical protein
MADAAAFDRDLNLLVTERARSVLEGLQGLLCTEGG